MPHYRTLTPATSRTSLTTLSTTTSLSSFPSRPTLRRPQRLLHTVHLLTFIVIIHLLISTHLTPSNPMLTGLSIPDRNLTSSPHPHHRPLIQFIVRLVHVTNARTLVDFPCHKHSAWMSDVLLQVDARVEYVCIDPDSKRLAQVYDSLRQASEERKMKFSRTIRGKLSGALVIALDMDQTENRKVEQWMARGVVVRRKGVPWGSKLTSRSLVQGGEELGIELWQFGDLTTH